ncbi:MAG: ATP-binding cassette domain-containing protein [Pseudomonadota bacterium]
MANEALKISVRDLHKRFGSNEVLKGVDLGLANGESVVVIGASGTGKSVLLRCILGLVAADKGEISIDGVDMKSTGRAKREKLRRQIGVLFQGAALFDSVPVWENVAFALLNGTKSQRTSRKDARERAEECLALVGLSPRVGALLPADLSGGMQKRVGLARAIAADPAVLFFDEPTTGLDPITADVINTLIVERVKAMGASAISITHDLASAKKIADRIVMLHEGRVIWSGPATELDQSGNPMVDQFVNGRADGPIKMSLRA